MSKPLMSQSVAVWLVDNTTLSFDQIAEFCELHRLEVQAIADGETCRGVKGVNPVEGCQVTREEINACERDPKRKLRLSEKSRVYDKIQDKHTSKSKYTPIAKRGDKPNAVLWLVQHYPELSNTQIVKLVGITKNTIEEIRTKNHWNYRELKARDPVFLGICSQIALDHACQLAKKRVAEEKKEEVEHKIKEVETGTE